MFKAIGRFFAKVKEGLVRTRAAIGGALRKLVGAGRVVDQQFLHQLEDTLLAADIGIDKTDRILAEVQARWKSGETAPGEDLLALLKRSLREELAGSEQDPVWKTDRPTVVLIVGVNGAGKTTTIAKLAKRWKDQGRRVILGAGDTYRAAAIDQLGIWAGRVGVDIVKGIPGGDAAAVGFDAIAAAQGRGLDTVIIDTAGRLHTKDHLMRELEKMRRVMQKRLDDAPHEVWLVIDATAGQNAIQQAKVFKESMGVTGLILTKLDGTAKGGAVVSVRRELGIPVRYIGVGEGMDDLQPFDPDAFVEAIFSDG